jgi:hypothetical protein
MNLEHIAKMASFLGLAARLVKPMGSLLGMHAIFNAGLPAAVDAATGQGSMKAKLGQGMRQFTKSFFNPANLASSVVGYNVLPAVGAKAIGTMGKGMQMLSPGSTTGKFFAGMEKGQGNSMFQNYILGQKAGFIPSIAIGSTLGERVGSSFTQLPQNEQMKQLMLNGGILPKQQ